MKTLVKIFFTMILGVTLSHAAAFSKDAKFRTTQVHITADKPITTGGNIFLFELKKNGTLITDAKVSVKAFMPAMPGMPAMSSQAVAKNLGDGKYSAPLNLVMNGTWQLHIFITQKSGQKSRIKTSLNF